MIHVAVDGGDHRANSAVAATEVLGAANHGEVCRRIVCLAAWPLLVLGYGVEDADSGPLGESRQQLSRAQDGDWLLRNRVTENTSQLGRAPNASTIV